MAGKRDENGHGASRNGSSLARTSQGADPHIQGPSVAGTVATLSGTMKQGGRKCAEAGLDHKHRHSASRHTTVPEPDVRGRETAAEEEAME